MHAGVEEPIGALARVAEDFHEGLERAGGDQPGIGDDQRPVDAEPQHPAGQFRERASAEQRGRGKREGDEA